MRTTDIPPLNGGHATVSTLQVCDNHIHFCKFSHYFLVCENVSSEV